MSPELADWLNLGLRWFHVIAGISWIGSSFYFMWLDSHLAPPEQPRERVQGELWMVHSGGFYRVEKIAIGPGQMPRTLHWFKWEAALTWISGIFLLGVVYYLSGGVYLLDRRVSGLGVGGAIALSVGLLAVSWLVYDRLWDSPRGRSGPVAPAVSFLLVTGVAFGLTRLLSGRAAFIHVGAMLGTLMVANVWLRILPAQRQMIDATAMGQAPDFTLGARAKVRSVHNSYMTFPVIFLMLSNHYPGAYGHRLNWVVLGLLIVVGAGIRHLMIGEGRSRAWTLAPVAAATAALLHMTAATPSPPATSGGTRVPFSEVRAIIHQRCVACHSTVPSDRTFGAAPAGVSLDTPESIQRLADRIKARVVTSQTMPLGNKTGLTPEERGLVGRWVDQGARLE